jgi:glucose/arabinose dehydrogenase
MPVRPFLTLFAGASVATLFVFGGAMGACSTSDAGAPESSHLGGIPDASAGRDASGDATSMIDVVEPRDVVRGDAPALGAYCSLPGSVVWNNGAPTTVPGGDPSLEDVSWLQLPDGFCAHYFGNVAEVRQIRFAPNGDLFAASPSMYCAGGAGGGAGSIFVLPDDDHDGVADAPVTYLGGLPVTQGIAFSRTAPYSIYYQNDKVVMAAPYNLGDRVGDATAATQIIDIGGYYSSTHWPKAIDVDDDGNVFVTSGGDQASPDDSCLQPSSMWAYRGSVWQVDGTPGGTMVSTGFRNPIALRCAKGTGACFGLELARDFAPQQGSREKLFPVQLGADYGQPCCATQNLPFTDSPTGTDCSGIASEITSFLIDHTPFGLDFEQGAFPGMWQYRAFVVLHGFVGSWEGARVVGIATNPTTGWPVDSSEADAGTALSDFGVGWYLNGASQNHGRPASITFAPDGRMFIGNDINGDIIWVSPVTTATAGDR